MSQADNPYASFGSSTAVAYAPATERSAFIKKTYIHLAAAVYAFAAFEYAIFQTGMAEQFLSTLRSTPYLPLMVMGGFLVVSYVANNWALNAVSLGKQYAGLFLYVLAQAVIFIPILYYAIDLEQAKGIQIIGPAALTTLVIFAGLTAAVFFTGADFSFLRTGLMFSGFAILGLMICSAIFGFHTGVFLTVAVIALAGGYILYYTSNVLHHYQTTQYVAAALALFSSVALLFMYILRLYMDRR